RIAEHEFAKGVRFDLTVAPAIFGGDIKVPNATLPSGCHPWRCSPDYSIFTYRHDLEWKDKVYAEVSYVRLTDESTLIRTEIVNNSELIQNCVINFFESIEYPSPDYCRLSLPEKRAFKRAVEYDSYDYAVKRPWDEQNADGFKKGEFADNRFVGGFGLGDRAGKWHMPHRYLPPFGAEKGDSFSLTLRCDNSFENAVLAVRYRTSDINYEQGKMVGVNYIPSEKSSAFLLNGEKTVFDPTDELSTVLIPLGKVEKGDFKISLEALGTGGIEFDFFCICEKNDASEIITETAKYGYVPEFSAEAQPDGGYKTVCKYPCVDGEFVLRTFNSNTRLREIATGALEDCMTARLSNSDPTFDDVTESFTGSFSRKHSDDGFFNNAIIHTIFVKPHGRHIEYAVISKGETEYKSAVEYEKIYNSRLEEAAPVSLNRDGKKYEQSYDILKATVMTNAVYPIYKHGEYIIHHTPGKRWDCLYTWDSGFIGLGMLDYSERFAEYSLDTYLSDESNPDYAFLHHGSPVPVQMYLYLEMLKRSNDKSKLLAMYPRAKLYYDFLAGKVRGSTTAKLKSGLTTTYDYFYSTSGMDDYPAQVAMMDRNIRDTTAPVISTSQLIRCGKILRMAASKLGKADDASEYTADIERLTNALTKYSWDEKSGYFSYVLHDKDYNPTGFMLTEDGENLNKGLDGIYPIIAGACNEEQREAILGHLKNEKEMLSPYGISAVDMTAGYFMVNGYWNGNVWFPHQWFIWKSMLDLGESDFAYTVARLALDIWKREVDYSYYTFEMVNVVTGRGGWFHNFGGLSTPITMWANAYFKAGTLNTGFDTWVDFAEFTDDNKKLRADLTYFGNGEKFTVLAAMSDDESIKYKVTLDGKEIPFTERFKGTLEIPLSIADNEIHTLTVE
ncbi:MAG: trehalase family glycosidase, partial [Oscillospiraceae bacterium]|nr:trehalase family glycosidase [Oscillospiraceae bacterium]